jgi:MFS family permease
MKETNQLQANQNIAPNPNRWKALGLLALAQFVIILDTSIIGVALPTIQNHFGFSQGDLQRIFNAYVIVFGALLLLGGRLTDILGQKKNLYNRFRNTNNCIYCCRISFVWLCSNCG